MKNTILLICLLLSLPVFAQNHFVGIKGGVSWTDVITENYPLDDMSNRTGFTGGLSYQYMLQKGFYLGADLVYAQKGYQVGLTFVDSNGNIYGNVAGSDAPVEFDFDYLSLPLKVGFAFGNKFGGFANVGLVPSVLIKAQTTTPAFPSVGEQTYENTKDLTQYDIGALLEIGGSVAIYDRFKLCVSAGYQQDFISITSDDYQKGSEIRNYGFNLSMGVQYALKAE